MGREAKFRSVFVRAAAYARLKLRCVRERYSNLYLQTVRYLPISEVQAAFNSFIAIVTPRVLGVLYEMILQESELAVVLACETILTCGTARLEREELRPMFRRYFELGKQSYSSYISCKILNCSYFKKFFIVNCSERATGYRVG